MFGGVGALGLFVKGVLLIGGLWWCKEVLGRFGKDLHRVRWEADATEKGVIVFIWGLTLVIAFFIVRFIAGLLKAILVYF